MDSIAARFDTNTFYPNAMSERLRTAVASPPLVSVVTRTKDRPILLHRAIASVLNQRYPHWRMFIVNDGGDPSSVEAVVAAHARLAENRIRVLHHEKSLGMEAASNTALSVAEGDYVAIHDDDDSWHPDFLSTTVDFLEQEQNRRFAGVITNCRLVGERIADGVVIEESQSDWADFAEYADFQRMIVQNNFPPICLLFRHSLLDRIGGFCEALPVLGDWEFNLRALMVGDLAVIGRQLAYYHHRVEDAVPAYNNTLTTGIDRHHATNVLLRNAILRGALQRDPALMGVIQPLLFRINALERLFTSAQAEMRGEVRTIREELQALRVALDRARTSAQEEMQVAESRFVREEFQALRGAMHEWAEQARRPEALEFAVSLAAEMNTLRARVDEIAVVSAWHRKMLRPVHAVWRRMLPLRRCIARLRGRL